MLIRPRPYQALGRLRTRQSGVVLLITLIVLVAMTLASIALVRSVDTTNIIAGNLSFQQATTRSTDIGNEIAMQWLQANRLGTTLQANQVSNNPIASQGYSAIRADPPPGQSWDTYWANTLNGFKATVSFTSGLPNPAGPAPAGSQFVDPSGNRIEYVIQRMCLNPGNPVAATTSCSSVPPQLTPDVVSDSGNSGESGATLLKPSGAYYYRITVRVAGPRNTVSYVQSIVTL